MKGLTKEELAEAMEVVASTISNCEKMQPKFAEGTSQHTLLKNRIKALHISSSMLKGENVMSKYTKEELMEALSPIASIISKCEKAQLKFPEGTAHHTRLKKIVKAMNISQSLIEDNLMDKQ